MELQLVELHFRQQPPCNLTAVKVRAETILGSELGTSDLENAKGVFLFIHKNHLAKYSDDEVPVQTAILAADQSIDIKCYAEDIQQSWSCRDAAALLEQSQHTLLVTEMMARQLAPVDRVRLFHGVLQGVIEETHPDALVFKHSQQVVEPSAYLAATSKTPINRPGSLNVRFFNISNSDGDMIMDTRGLHDIGLYDLQCHFRELDPNQVSRVLFNTALYLFENGPVFEAGHTVAGVGPDSKWVCQFEKSLLQPTRDILDLNPGIPFAAGGRK